MDPLRISYIHIVPDRYRGTISCRGAKKLYCSFDGRLMIYNRIDKAMWACPNCGTIYDPRPPTPQQQPTLTTQEQQRLRQQRPNNLIPDIHTIYYTTTTGASGDVIIDDNSSSGRPTKASGSGYTRPIGDSLKEAFKPNSEIDKRG